MAAGNKERYTKIVRGIVGEEDKMAEVTQKLMDDIHRITFSVLCDIDDFCKENGIVYYLSGGSCLGAVRHNGFIPWDHDADIMMPRKDYERFLLQFGEKYPEKYRVVSLLTEKKWVRTYSKVWDTRTKLFETTFTEMERGIAVDVFPIDGLPENRILRSLFYKKTFVLTYLRKQMVRNEFRKDEKLVWVKKLLTKLFGICGSRYLAVKLDNMAQKYDFDTSKYVGVSMACHYWDKETIEKKYMQNQVFLPFEGRKFPVVNGYDQYLKNLYGDYMKVPEGMAAQQEKFISTWNLHIDGQSAD